MRRLGSIILVVIGSKSAGSMKCNAGQQSLDIGPVALLLDHFL